MAPTLKPENADQVVQAVAWAAAEEMPLEILGRGSKRGLGRPVQAAHSLELSALSGIGLYEPDELVLAAQAGTPLAEIEAALDAERQMLAFEPADLGPLLGVDPGQGSIGGTLACNLSGPRRIKAGAARDHFLGLYAVSGRGELFKSGGRVVKNVTGYDMCKLLAGSHGTLAVLTQITVKVMPAPEKTRSVLLYGLTDARALEAMTRALQSSHEVSGAAHLPAPIAAKSQVALVAKGGGAVTALRVEGPQPSVAYRCAALRRELGDLGETEELHSQNSRRMWRELRDVTPFLADPERIVWRISVPPRAGPAVAARIAGAQIASGRDALYFFDWGGGLIWLALAVPPGGDGGGGDWDGDEAMVRGALRNSAPGNGGGHATLIRAPDELRAALPVFQPQETAAAALAERIKAGFDPNRVLNPGRMYPGV